VLTIKAVFVITLLSTINDKVRVDTSVARNHVRKWEREAGCRGGKILGECINRTSKS